MKFNKKDFPFCATFKSVANIITPKEKDKSLALASLDNLKTLLQIPEEQIINNPDLLYISGDLFIGGVANKNGHAISKRDAIELAKQIPHKYLNIEHEENIVVGALLNYGFREYTQNRDLIDIKDIEAYKKPIVASAGGYIWRSLNADLADLLIEASNESGDNFGKASFSWEVYFKDYAIMEGSSVVDEATIITDPQEIKVRDSSLKSKGGSGIYNGKEIYQLILGPKLFLGAGIVATPAADVKGIITSETNVIISEDINDIEESESNYLEKMAASTQKNKKNYKIISQIKQRNVNKYKTMKFKNLEDLEKAIASLSENDEVDAKLVADIQANFNPLVEKATAGKVAEAIKAKSEEYAAELQAEKDAIVKANEEKAIIEQKLVDLESAKAALDSKLNELEDQLKAEAAERLFSERMEALNNEFAINEEEDLKKVVATQIKNLNEVDYENWLSSFKILAKKHSKAEASVKSDEVQVENSESEEAEKAIAAAKAEVESQIPNTPEVSLSEEFKLKFEVAK